MIDDDDDDDDDDMWPGDSDMHVIIISENKNSFEKQKSIWIITNYCSSVEIKRIWIWFGSVQTRMLQLKSRQFNSVNRFVSIRNGESSLLDHSHWQCSLVYYFWYKSWRHSSHASLYKCVFSASEALATLWRSSSKLANQTACCLRNPIRTMWTW